MMRHVVKKNEKGMLINECTIVDEFEADFSQSVRIVMLEPFDLGDYLLLTPLTEENKCGVDITCICGEECTKNLGNERVIKIGI